MALLEVQAIDTYYGRVQALRSLSLHVDRGEIVALIGSNGAGKTTTLNTISALLHPAVGSISFEARPIHQMKAHKVADLGICHVPEGRQLFTRMSVLDNLLIGAYRRDDRAEISRDLQHVYSLFPRLLERVHQIAGTLSGGEQQMVAMGRALMSKPSLMMLDEPSLGLAPMLVDTIFTIIEQINAEGIAVLLVEQNAHRALEISHRAYVLETGSVVMEGPSGTLLNSTVIQKAYLGV